ncbi:hypothetical protein DNTS_027558 [Danionella cerebrum]|uniref:PKD domain-containing protein n=1 Tax=Danionella cerebrum TaxID=2873325 RepID=A0A553RQN3_9TELE|nr:hypothetical protein DNTS_027558 [Danionella translucida]
MISLRTWSGLVHTLFSLLSSSCFGIPNEPSHQLSGNVKGKVILHQTERNSTYLQDGWNLASCTRTMVSFELLDPRHNLHLVNFIYSWDLGNGELHKGPEPFVKCYYTSPGNYTLKLSIESRTPQHSRMTGLYAVDLTVLDAIKSIELRGPLIYNVDQSSILSFLVVGSPPVWLCWRVLPDCHTPSSTSCNLVRLRGNIFNLNYTFKSVGKHCLDLSVKNDISSIQTFYHIYVQGSSVTLFFMLPCAAVIIASLILISVTVCRPHKQKKGGSTHYISFTDIELHAKNVPEEKTSFSNESQPLLHQLRASLNT